MISIQLGPEPKVLRDNGVAWGEEYERSLANGGKNKPERYRRDDVRDALRKETHRKCAYCESIVEHVSYSHIEHILPKELFPLLVCSWPNLTWSCAVCNTNKGMYFDSKAPLLNPYTDRTESDIVFWGPMAIDRCERGKLTISRLRLNRPELLHKRQEALSEVLRIIELIVSNRANHAMKNALIEDLRARLGKDAEYSSCVFCFVQVEAPYRGLSI